MATFIFRAVLLITGATLHIHWLFGPLPPMGDERYGLFGSAVIILLLAALNAAVVPAPWFASIAFGGMFGVSTLVTWAKVAHQYHYAFGGPQLLAHIIETLIFASLVWGMNWLGVRLRVRRR